MKTGSRIGILVLVIGALAVAYLGFGGANPAASGSAPASGVPELSLAQAASQPSGIAEGDSPAADVGASGASAPDVDPEALLGSSTDAVVSTGCHKDYGVAGQCLPAVPPSPQGYTFGDPSAPTWTCSGVRSMYPSGIVLGTPGVDPLGLDTNGNGTACDPTDGG